ncbi:MAG: hypothetical protein RLZZ15_4207, partial [Verrucomicrobiota bacterium]
MRPPSLPTFLRAIFSLVAALAAARAFAAEPAPFTAREIAQGFRDHVVLAKPHAAHRATVDAAETREGLRVHKKFSRFGDLRAVELDDSDNAPAALARLRATGRYEFVDVDRLYRATVTPNDPQLANQWAMNNNGQSNGVPGADIKALAAWDILRDAPGIIVAVVDSGLNTNHQDIAANVWRNPAPTFGDVNGARFLNTGRRGAIADGAVADDNGHGTHVAGTVGAVGNNGSGAVGVAWRVQIMPVKVLTETGIGSTTDIIAGIDYAVARGAQIINASFGETAGSGFDAAMFASISAARAAGVLFVAAAGNDASDLNLSAHYPASFALDNIVTVGSSNRNDFVSTFSNYGAPVDLLAPGEAIVSLLYSNNTGTATLSGTSMAAPHVSGALALLKTRFPSDTPRQLVNRLLRATDPGDKFLGKAVTNGRLNLLRALTSTDNRPFNDDFATRARLVGSNLIGRSSNVGATAEAGEPAHAGTTAAASLWWEWTAPATGEVSVDTAGSGYDTLLALYTGTALDALTPVIANDNDRANLTSRLIFIAQAGVTYQIAVAGKNGATGLTLLNLGTTPANDLFADAVKLSGRNARITGSNAHCSLETGEPRILGFAGGTSLWYAWTAPAGGQFQVAATSTDFDPLLGVFTGATLGTLVSVAANDNAAPGTLTTGSLCTFTAVAGTTYFFKVDSKSLGTIGQFTLTLNDSRWQAITGSAITGSPAVADDGTVYVGSTDRSLYAFNADGTTKWTFATANIIDTCSPAIGADGTVYVGSFDGRLYAVNPDGTQKWARSFNPTTATAFTAANSPTLAADGTIYLKPSDGFLHALNPDDGATKWSRNLNGPASYASAALASDGTIYQGTDRGNQSSAFLYALNPADGSVKWRYPADTTTVLDDIYTAPAIDAAGNIYFGVLNSAKFYSLTPTGALRWVYAGAT